MRPSAAEPICSIVSGAIPATAIFPWYPPGAATVDQLHRDGRGLGDDDAVRTGPDHPGDERRHIDRGIERDVGLVDEIGRALEHRLDEVRDVPPCRVVRRDERDRLGPSRLERGSSAAARRRAGGDREHASG